MTQPSEIEAVARERCEICGAGFLAHDSNFDSGFCDDCLDAYYSSLKDTPDARCRKGSNRRRKIRARLAVAHDAVRRQRETHLHQVSAGLVRRFGQIAIEKLNVKGLAKSILARDVNDASWGRLISMLRYKAERAGSVLIEVDPRGTSQTCPDCGQIKAKELSERVHKCDCGCVMDRDVAAAKIIEMRAVRGPLDANVGGYVMRSPRKAVA